MIKREDILSLAYLNMSEYTGSHDGMRYRLEKVAANEGEQLSVSVWKEPYNYLKTPKEEIENALFDFSEDGITDGIAWMNDRLFAYKNQ